MYIYAYLTIIHINNQVELDNRTTRVVTWGVIARGCSRPKNVGDTCESMHPKQHKGAKRIFIWALPQQGQGLLHWIQLLEVLPY